MRSGSLTAFALVVLSCSVAAAFADRDHHHREGHQPHHRHGRGGGDRPHNPSSDFVAFSQKYNRRYASEDEASRREAIYHRNMARARELQALNPHATFGENEFSDMAPEEFKVRHNAEAYYARQMAKRKPVPKIQGVSSSNASSIDWRAKGAVTYVKNQGQCGSCWSFSTTGNIEGQWFLAGNKLVAVSEQELVSCDTTNNGCDGGIMDNAFEWLVSAHNGGIVAETAYPYVSGSGTAPACQMPSSPVVATITGHQDLPTDESSMAAWMLTGGPISIGVDATSWQTYTGGIMTNCVASQVDHGVLAVGFDDSSNPPYWIIKNSWGPTWGENGYIRIQKGVNECLISSVPCTSTVANGPSPTIPPAPPATPAPPLPPTPPSPPSGGNATWTRYTCDSSSCDYGCTQQSFPQGECVQLNNYESAVAVCDIAGDFYMQVYYESTQCTGASSTTVTPPNTCVHGGRYKYFLDVCNSGSGSGSSASGGL